MNKRGYVKRVDGKARLTLMGRNALAGYTFILPFLIGFIGIFLPMIFKSIQFSFSNMTVGDNGYELTKAANGGLEHYIRALTIDPDFNQMLLNAIVDMCTTVPLVLIFSFFMANILNQKFHGRAAARSILFFPVILTSGVILGLENSDLLISTLNPTGETAADLATMHNVASLLLNYTDLPESVVLFLANAVNGVYDIIIASGVQILIFLSGLQSISPSLYESASMEGATAWETFWKITFPMISPLILVNSIYTIIDSFISETNEIMTEIEDTIFTEVKYGLGSAMAWIYFICIVVILLVVGGIISKHVYYNDEP